VVFWAPSSKSVLAKSQRRLGSLILSERPATVDDATALPVLFKVCVREEQGRQAGQHCALCVYCVH
jgi:hypothetical protein